MSVSIGFDDWVWNPNTLELRKGSHVATLEPRVARLFEYFVAHPGELLTRDQLIDAVWDGRVVSDEAVRRGVFNLRQAFAAGGSDSYIRTVHKKGYIANFPTPRRAQPESQHGRPAPDDDGAKEGERVPSTPEALAGEPREHAARLPKRFVALAIIAVASLLGAAWLYSYMPSRSQPADIRPDSAIAEPVAIAVLPVVNASKDPAGQFLADGLTDELLATLERNRDLRVTARGSAFQVDNQQADTAQLAQRLGVRYLLEGQVSGDADQLRVQLSLTDTAKGVAIWTDRYESAASDWFALQQAITTAVARAVQSRLHVDAQAVDMPRRADSEEAQMEVLRARQLLLTRSVADAEQAIEHLQRALTLDPNYALAYARLADAILIQAESTTGIKTVRPVVAPVLEKALALDPALGEAYALRSQLADDPTAAARDLRRGLDLNPSYARGYELLASSPLAVSEAIAAIDSAIALDPLTPGYYHTKALLKMGQGKWEEAAELDRRALELNPNYRAALAQLSMTYGVEGQFADAVAYARRAVALDPRAVPLREHLILMYLAVGDLDSARAANNPPTVGGSQAIMWAEGRATDLAESIYSEGQVSDLDMPFTASIASHVLLRQAVSDRDYGRAVALLSPLLLVEGGLHPRASGWGLYAYVNLAQLLRLSGDIAAASRLEDELERRMEAMTGPVPRHRLINEQLRAILLARAGHSDEACAALNYSYTPNPRLYWKLILDNPAFDGMVDTPCFRALRKRIDKYIATERAQIDAMQLDEDAVKSVTPNNDDNGDAAT